MRKEHVDDGNADFKKMPATAGKKEMRRRGRYFATGDIHVSVLKYVFYSMKQLRA